MGRASNVKTSVSTSPGDDVWMAGKLVGVDISICGSIPISMPNHSHRLSPDASEESGRMGRHLPKSWVGGQTCKEECKEFAPGPGRPDILLWVCLWMLLREHGAFREPGPEEEAECQARIAVAGSLVWLTKAMVSYYGRLPIHSNNRVRQRHDQLLGGEYQQQGASCSTW